MQAPAGLSLPRIPSKQSPVRIRGEDNAGEYVIGDLAQLPYLIHRLEFQEEIRDSGHGRFAVLNLVAGERVEIVHDSSRTELRYAETIIIPASMGEWVLVNKGAAPCKIVKAFIR